MNSLLELVRSPAGENFAGTSTITQLVNILLELVGNPSVKDMPELIRIRLVSNLFEFLRNPAGLKTARAS